MPDKYDCVNWLNSLVSRDNSEIIEAGEAKIVIENIKLRPLI